MVELYLFSLLITQLISGTGIQTAALSFGGDAAGTLDKVESYDGTTWTTITSLPSVRYSCARAGTQTAALCIGGDNGGPIINNTEFWNGSSWAAGGSLPTALGEMGGNGTSTSAISFGGRAAFPSPTASAAAQLYNGTSWTATGNLSSGGSIGGFGLGGSTPNNSSSLFMGGSRNSGSTTATEAFTGPGAPVTKSITTS